MIHIRPEILRCFEIASQVSFQLKVLTFGTIWLSTSSCTLINEAFCQLKLPFYIFYKLTFSLLVSLNYF